MMMMMVMMMMIIIIMIMIMMIMMIMMMVMMMMVTRRIASHRIAWGPSLRDWVPSWARHCVTGSLLGPVTA